MCRFMDLEIYSIFISKPRPTEMLATFMGQGLGTPLTESTGSDMSMAGGLHRRLATYDSGIL